jgi:hypothetical protein
VRVSPLHASFGKFGSIIEGIYGHIRPNPLKSINERLTSFMNTQALCRLLGRIAVLVRHIGRDRVASVW